MVLKHVAQPGVYIGVTYNILNLLCNFGGASAAGPYRECFLMCHIESNRLLRTCIFLPRRVNYAPNYHFSSPGGNPCTLDKRYK